MNKLYNYIVNNFIDVHARFVKAWHGYAVEMYIDQVDDYKSPWTFNTNDINNDIVNLNYLDIRSGGSDYYKSLTILLSNYGLSKEELHIVYKMILEKILMKLNQLNGIDSTNDSINDSINESVDKKQKLFDILSDVFIHQHYNITIDHDKKTFEVKMEVDDENFWFVDPYVFKNWLGQNIDWTYTNTKDLTVSNMVDNMFIKFMVNYNIKDRETIQQFYHFVLTKLMEKSEDDFNNLLDKGYQEGE